MKQIFTLLVTCLLLGCSELELVEPVLPDWQQLSMETITTDLPIINIEVAPDAFERMYENFTEDIFVPARFSVYAPAPEGHELLLSETGVQLEY
ncbi:MAG: hypothetical protein AAFO94_23035 [Bacteroidota bacterium]